MPGVSLSPTVLVHVCAQNETLPHGALLEKAGARDPVGGSDRGKATSLEPQVPFFIRPGDGNEAIGTLIQSYIREIEELR